MTWTTAGNIKGPQGNPGPQGRGIASATKDGSDHLIITYSDSTTADVGLIKGPAGANGADGADGTDGKSVTIVASVANAAALPTGLGTGDAGKGWITSDTGHLWVWSGSAFTDVGEIKGPKGDPGTPGATGATGATGTNGTRGSIWFDGAGAPGTIAGQQLGDRYLDTTTGDVYRLD